MQTLLQEVLRKPVPLVVKEDNSACIQAIRKGYSPTLRHLKRTQRVSVAQLHEAFEERGAEQGGDGPVTLEHAETKTHKGDLFTKYMAPATYREALGRLGVTSRRTRLAGGAARVQESSGECRRCRRRRTRRNATTTTHATVPLAQQPANHNANHNTQQQQHKQPRRRRRRRTTTTALSVPASPTVPLAAAATPGSSSSSRSTQKQVVDTVAAAPAEKQQR